MPRVFSNKGGRGQQQYWYSRRNEQEGQGKIRKRGEGSGGAGTLAVRQSKARAEAGASPPAQPMRLPRLRARVRLHASTLAPLLLLPQAPGGGGLCSVTTAAPAAKLLLTASSPSGSGTGASRGMPALLGSPCGGCRQGRRGVQRFDSRLVAATAGRRRPRSVQQRRRRGSHATSACRRGDLARRVVPVADLPRQGLWDLHCISAGLATSPPRMR